MSSVTKSIAAGDSKARCLALLDEVVPVTDQPTVSLLGSAKYRSESDLLAPIDESWDADR